MKNGLHELFTPPEGFVFVKGVGCTYSVQEKALEAVRKVLCGRGAGRQTAFEEGRSFRLYFQQGEYSGAAKNCLVPVSPGAGCLHAKLYALQYRTAKGAEELYRVIVTSANLTNEDELNLFACFDSGREGNGSLGREAAGLFRKILENTGERDVLDGFLAELSQAKFDSAPQLFLPGGGRFQDVFQADIRSACAVTVVSPFLSERVLQKLQRGAVQAGPVRVVSRQEEIDALSSDCGCRFFTLGGEEADRAVPEALHAKAYIIEKEGGQGTVLYLGSANATEAAFQQNIEALVRVEAGFDSSELLENFRRYTRGGTAQPRDRGQRAFDRLCREIVHSFQAGEHRYSAARREGIALLLDGQCGQSAPQASVCHWERTRREKHIVRLEIADGAGHEACVPVFVDGESIRCRREDVWKDCLAACFGEKQGTAVEREPEQGQVRKMGQGRKPVSAVSELILRIRDEETAGKVLQVAESCLADRDVDETGRGYWQAVAAGIRSVFPVKGDEGAECTE